MPGADVVTTPSRRTIEWLERTLGYRSRNVELITAALTHRSAGGSNNERLEFLGDGVLNCVVADHLYRGHPEAREGELSRLRARLVRRESLAEIAAGIGLGELLIMGAGELRSGGFRRESILADALEALIGAIYLDGGFEAARGAIEQLMAQPLAELAEVAELKDPKTRLQEYLQARGLQLPHYAIDQVMGESHQQVFVVRCEVAALALRGTGSGASRRAAEQEAAEHVLAAIANLPDASRE
jgi:ribonuclease-3